MQLNPADLDASRNNQTSNPTVSSNFVVGIVAFSLCLFDHLLTIWESSLFWTILPMFSVFCIKITQYISGISVAWTSWILQIIV